MANFNDIIGQENIKKHLQTAIKLGNLSHAYIINGEDGSGRQTLASALAKHFNVKTVLLMATHAVYVNHANRQSLTIILILYISPMTNPA